MQCSRLGGEMTGSSRVCTFVKIGCENHVAVLANCEHAGLLTNGGDVGTADLVGASNVVLEVHLIRKVHLRGDRGEDEPLLSTVWKRELDLPVKSTWPKQGWVESICSVCRHDHLNVDRHVETVHLVEQFEQDPLDFTICPSLRVEPLGRNGVNLIDKHNRRCVLLCEPENVSDHPWSLSKVPVWRRK